VFATIPYLQLTPPDQARVLADQVRNVGQHLPEKEPALRLENLGQQIERLSDLMDEACSPPPPPKGETVPDLRNQARPALDRIGRALAELEEALVDLASEGPDHAHSKIRRATHDIDAATRTLKVLIETAPD